jgi:hypothetical protein
MHYCITEGDIDMIINEWPDEWRIPTIPREVPGQTTEEGLRRRKHNLHKSQYPRNEERAKPSRLRKTTA